MQRLHVIFSYYCHHTSKQSATLSVCCFLSFSVSGVLLCGFSSPAQSPAAIETKFRIALPLTAGFLTA